jgi:hypothetical protein
MIMDIMEDPRIKEFFQSRSLKPATIRNYTEALQKYTNLTPTQLIEEAEQEAYMSLLNQPSIVIVRKV